MTLKKLMFLDEITFAMTYSKTGLLMNKIN